MKLMRNILLIALFPLLFACGGGEDTSTYETEDSTTTASEVEEEETVAVGDTTVEERELSEVEQKFVKKWQMTSFVHEDGRKEEGLSGDYLNLMEDGTYEEIFKDNVVATGNWKVEEGTLVLNHETGEFMGTQEKLVVKEITEDKLITEDDEGKMTETFTPVEG